MSTIRLYSYEYSIYLKFGLVKIIRQYSTAGLMKFNIYRELLSKVTLTKVTSGVNGSFLVNIYVLNISLSKCN